MMTYVSLGQTAWSIGVMGGSVFLIVFENEVCAMQLGQRLVRHKRRDHRLVRFLRASHGASQAEYALLVALVVATAFFAVDGLSHASRDSMAMLTERTHRSSHSHHKARHAATNPTTSRASAEAIASPPPTTTSSPFFRYRMLVQFGFLAFSAVMVLMLHRQRKKLESKSLGDGQKISPEHHAKLFGKRQQILSILSGNTDAVTGGEMTVRQLMSDRLITVSPATRCEEVEAIMAESKLRHLLVCNKGQLVGVISDRDIHNPKNRNAKKATASGLMTPDPITASPEMLASPAVTLMMKRHISCLPVVDGGELVGLLTSTDLMMALQCSLQLLQQIAMEISPEVLPSPQSTSVQSRAEEAVRELISAGK